MGSPVSLRKQRPSRKKLQLLSLMLKSYLHQFLSHLFLILMKLLSLLFKANPSQCTLDSVTSVLLKELFSLVCPLSSICQSLFFTMLLFSMFIPLLVLKKKKEILPLTPLAVILSHLPLLTNFLNCSSILRASDFLHFFSFLIYHDLVFFYTMVLYMLSYVSPKLPSL